jgi:hypothetical protein
MTTFFENDPSLQSYWRSIILYGRNVASYKFALAKALIDLNKKPNDLIKLEDLADPFSNHLCDHLKLNDKQITSPNSELLNTLRKFNNGEIDVGKKNEITKKLGFNNVIDAFHEVNGNPIPELFYIDERKENGGIRLTNNFYKLLQLQESENFLSEVESRWRLVETAWKLGISVKLLQVKYDEKKEIFFIDTSNGRIDVTSSKNALNGYQKSKCFFCFDYISIIKKSDFLSDVDHFFPNVLKDKEFPGYIDGIYNLVLSCKSCNRGEDGKFAKLPSIKLLERLNKRNEYFCSSHHPLRETIIAQTGNTTEQRRSFLQKCFNEAKDKLIHTWEPEPKGISSF